MDKNPTSHILLVDDETAITENLAPFLERAGYKVATAPNGEEALVKIAKISPDLVVMDVLMPIKDGRQALRQLRSEDNWTPVILLTQVGESAERAMALEEGADDYLNKPFDPHELVARIRSVLRRAGQGQPPLAAVWVLPWYGQSSPGTTEKQLYAAAQVRGQWSPSACQLGKLQNHINTSPNDNFPATF